MTYEAKKRLRTASREAASRVTELQRSFLSKMVISKVEELPRFAESRIVAAYFALPDEVSTIMLLRRWSGLKKMLLPSIEAGRMVFREYTGEADLYNGAFGIRQPKRGHIVEPDEIEMMLVPGMAFDQRGYRLGRGKGFYDRYLAKPEAECIHKVGVCMPHQLFDSVPAEPHDIIMDQVVTSSPVTA